jgi:hypothetical protein
VFHEIPEKGSGHAYVLIPFKEQIGSLEHKSYESVVKRQLSTKGFRDVPVDNAKFAVFMRYGIDDGKQVMNTYPIIGQTGVSSSYTTGSLSSYGRYGSFTGTTQYTPNYGVVGTGVTTNTVYTRFFNLEILDKNALAENKIVKVYEGKVISEGAEGQLPVVMPTMIKALFEDFPGKSGSTRLSILSIED